MCLRGLWTVWVQQIPVIAVRSVECAEWVMRKNLILDSEYRCRSLRIPEKQRIMADAQTERNIEIRVAVVEQLRLSDGVAHGVSAVFNALMRLVDPTDLADDRFHGKVMSFEDRSQNLCFFNKTHAERNAELLKAAAVSEIDNFHNTG